MFTVLKFPIFRTLRKHNKYTFSGSKLTVFLRKAILLIQTYAFIRFFTAAIASLGHTSLHKWHPTHLLPSSFGFLSSNRMAWCPPSSHEMTHLPHPLHFSKSKVGKRMVSLSRTSVVSLTVSSPAPMISFTDFTPICAR